MTPVGPTQRGQETASRRWSRLVRTRRREMDRLVPGGGAVGAAYWDGRAARRYAARVSADVGRDPFLRRVRRVVSSRTTLLDVGAGPGRFSLALAPRVAEVVAVDASATMGQLTRRAARQGGITNLTTVTGRWEEVDIEPADVSICSFVLPLIDDAAGFLDKQAAASLRHGFLYLSALPTDAFNDAFWRYFHGKPRQCGPSYLDAVGVLGELGIKADVEVVEVPVRTRYTSVAAAARTYRQGLLLDDTAEVRRELRGLLTDWLIADGDAWRPPVRTTPAAVIHWSAR